MLHIPMTKSWVSRTACGMLTYKPNPFLASRMYMHTHTQVVMQAQLRQALRQLLVVVEEEQQAVAIHQLELTTQQTMLTSMSPRMCVTSSSTSHATSLR